MATTRSRRSRRNKGADGGGGGKNNKQEERPKMRRGRPRKDTSATTSTSADDTTPQTNKQMIEAAQSKEQSRRGRRAAAQEERKSDAGIAAVDGGGGAAAVVAPPKKRRGRPPKNKLPPPPPAANDEPTLTSTNTEALPTKTRRGRPPKKKLPASSPAKTNAESVPTKKRRGRPPKNKSKSSSDWSKDVLFLKGAAAQRTKHPGNLAFYALCEDRYDEWSALPDTHPTRREICEEIVDEVMATGGVFRKATGGVIDRNTSVQKAKDRMRQIGKAKIRPDANKIGENDVVFASGAANHLYPGNARWRALLDGYVPRYWKDMDSDAVIKRKKTYHTQVIEETINIIHDRGGTFRARDLQVLSHDEIVEKTSVRFKDLKKELRKGKLLITETGDVERVDCAGVQLTGCTSVKVTVAVGEDVSKKNGRKKRWRKCKDSYQNDDDDNESFDSAMLDSDNSDGEDEDDSTARDDKWKDMVARRPSKRRQDQDRRNRLKRRKSAEAVKNMGGTRRKRQKASRPRRSRATRPKEEERLPPSPAYELSQYELKRLERIKRNQQRLADLGLADSL